LDIGPQQNSDPKSTYFQLLRNSVATLRANISGKEHDIDKQETGWNLRRVPYIVSKYHELWSTNG